MTQEIYAQAMDVDRCISQCDKALQYMTHGVFHRHDKDSRTFLPLPEEVCMEIREVIEKWKGKYETEFEEL